MGVRGRRGETGMSPPWKFWLRTKNFQKAEFSSLIPINWLNSYSGSLFSGMRWYTVEEKTLPPQDNFPSVSENFYASKSLPIPSWIQKNVTTIQLHLDPIWIN